MKAVIALILFTLIGGVCCKPQRDAWQYPENSGERTLAQTDGGASIHNQYSRSDIDKFKEKIVRRLNSSQILASQPEAKRHLLSVALDMFKKCETPANNNHSCLGTVTGQAMRIIANYEQSHKKNL